MAKATMWCAFWNLKSDTLLLLPSLCSFFLHISPHMPKMTVSHRHDM